MKESKKHVNWPLTLNYRFHFWEWNSLKLVQFLILNILELFIEVSWKFKFKLIWGSSLVLFWCQNLKIKVCVHFNIQKNLKVWIKRWFYYLNSNSCIFLLLFMVELVECKAIIKHKLFQRATNFKCKIVIFQNKKM